MQQQQTERWTQQMQQMYERAAEWLKGFWQTLCTLWQDPHKRVRLMVAAGFAGMGLILCSRLCQPPKAEGRPMAAAQTTETAPEASLEQQLAENLGRMLGQLEGAGECQVMVTLRQSPRTVYASEQNSRARSSGEIYPIDQEQQNKPVLVRDAQGVTRPLVEATLAAQVNGVLVVCPGANSARVCQQITEAVTTVLGIKSTQVCVFAGNR